MCFFLLNFNLKVVLSLGHTTFVIKVHGLLIFRVYYVEHHLETMAEI